MTHHPVFLLLGAEGIGKEKLFHVESEVLSLEELIVQSTDLRMQCQAVTTAKDQVLKTKVKIYRSDTSIFHFSGHAGGGAIAIQDQQLPGEILKQILMPGDSKAAYPKLKFAFLNACDTAVLTPVFIEAGVEYIIATTQGIDDALAADFARNFYYEFLRNKNSFFTAFEAASASANQAGIQVAFKRGLATARNKQPLWGLYCAEGAQDFTIDDILPPPPIADITEPTMIPVDSFLSKLNRHEQEQLLREVLFTESSAQKVQTAAMVGGTAHCPNLLIKRMEEVYQCSVLEYSVPTKFTREQVYAHLKRVGHNERGRWAKMTRIQNLAQLIASSANKRKPLIIWTYADAETSRIPKIVEEHHAFWRQVLAPATPVLALLVINPVALSKKGAWSWFSSWSAVSNSGSVEHTLTELPTILERDLDEWEIAGNERPAEQQFFSKLYRQDYRSAAQQLEKCERGGMYLAHLRTMINTLIAKA